MISDPVKFQFVDEHKNFCFRPQSPKLKENIKLRPFVTDKLRIEKFIESKNRENDIINKNKRKNKKFNTITETEEKNDKLGEKEKKQNDNYLQPIMKFRPRTDLERIFDTINLNYYGKISKNLVNEQLKSLGLLKVYNKKNATNQNEYSLLREKLKVNPETLEYLIKEKQILEQGPKTKEIHELINNMDNIIQINKEMKSEKLNKEMVFGNSDENQEKQYKIKRRNLNNFLAKNILGEYQKKTHFKALCTYSLDLEDNNFKDKKIIKYNSLDNLDYYKNDNDNAINTYQFKKRFKKNKLCSPNKMSYLKHLFTLKEKKPELNIPEKDKRIIEMEAEQNEIIKRQNNVLINGKYFNKKDLKGISDAILKKCNYVSKHFEPNNTGNGKLMFTRGMSVNEFAKKYGLPK